ncbi:MAG: tRNA (guanosine(46)-N(7))-methyltransferase TrmB [Candidatus Binatia bacterium]
MRDGRAPAPVFSWRAVFDNDNPVAIEVGPGRGEFLRAIARDRPHWNFFAIERSAARARAIERELEAAALPNARVLCADAACLLPLLPEASAAAVFVQFPDPWWKRRHQRRRVWTPEFAAAVRRVLQPGATVEFLTDVEETFRLGVACLEADGGFEPVAIGCVPSHNTMYARKALNRGDSIFRSVHRRAMAGGAVSNSCAM